MRSRLEEEALRVATRIVENHESGGCDGCKPERPCFKLRWAESVRRLTSPEPEEPGDDPGRERFCDG